MDRGIEAALAVVLGGGAALGGLWVLDKKTNLFKNSSSGGGTITIPGGTVPSGGSSGGNPGGSKPPNYPPTTQPTTIPGCAAQGIVLRYGSSGNCVVAVQKEINYFSSKQCPQANVTSAGTVDGQFGPQTLAAVKSFQNSQGITIDGVVGPQTWRSLAQPVCHTASQNPTGGGTSSGSGRCPYGYFGQTYQIINVPFPAVPLTGSWFVCLPAPPATLPSSVTGGSGNCTIWISLGSVDPVFISGSPSLAGYTIHGVARYSNRQLEAVYLQSNNPGAKGSVIAGANCYETLGAPAVGGNVFLQ